MRELETATEADIPEELYQTFVSQLASLTPETRIYPGHDYLTNNLEFTLDREPDNARAKDMLSELERTHDPENPYSHHDRSGDGNQYFLSFAEPDSNSPAAGIFS